MRNEWGHEDGECWVVVSDCGARHSFFFLNMPFSCKRTLISFPISLAISIYFTNFTSVRITTNENNSKRENAQNYLTRIPYCISNRLVKCEVCWAEMEIRFLHEKVMFSQEITIDRHGPRPLPNIDTSTPPPPFSLFILKGK